MCIHIHYRQAQVAPSYSFFIIFMFNFWWVGGYDEATGDRRKTMLLDGFLHAGHVLFFDPRLRAVSCGHGLMRSPLASTTSCIRFGSFRQSPSTSQLSLISWQMLRKHVPSSSTVSFQGVTGLVRVSRTRIQETAVSCNMTS